MFRRYTKPVDVAALQERMGAAKLGDIVSVSLDELEWLRMNTPLPFDPLRALVLRLSAAVCDLLVQSPVTDRETRREIEGLIEEVRKSANAAP